MSTQRYQDIRFKPDSLERIAQINEIIDEYVAQSFRLTVRQLYYQLVARGINRKHRAQLQEHDGHRERWEDGGLD